MTIENIVVSNSSLNVSINPNAPIKTYVLSGNGVTLANDLVISASATPNNYVVLTFINDATNIVTTSGTYSLKIFGTTIRDGSFFNVKSTIEACYSYTNGWTVTTYPGVNQALLAAADIKNTSVTTTKLIGLTPCSVVVTAPTTGYYTEKAMTDGQLIVGDTTLGPLAKTMSGDATLTKAGLITIANDAITTAKVLDEAITLNKQADITQGSIIVGGTSDRPTAIAVGNAEILVGDGTDINAVSMSGDATMDNAGVITINPAILPVGSRISRLDLVPADITTLYSSPSKFALTGATGLPDIFVYCASSDPTTGDSAMTLLLTYHIDSIGIVKYAVVESITFVLDYATTPYVFPATGLQVGYSASGGQDVINEITQAECQYNNAEVVYRAPIDCTIV